MEQKAFLIQNNDEKILKESTSGGAFTAFAQSIIKNDGVVFGAAFDDDFVVRHTYTDTLEGLKKFRNSKYVQSKMDDSYSLVKKFLSDGRIVCFSGTPCQVEGLYYYLGKKYENLLLIDTICRAVPSPLVWEKYKKYCHQGKYSMQAAAFRSKEKYGYQYSQMTIKYQDGTIKERGVESDPYLRAFFSGLSIRPSCYECLFKKRYRISDITIWDCFDVYRFDISFDDNRGVTRVLTHTQKGEDAIQNIENCHCVEIEPDKAVEGVHELIKAVSNNNRRADFFSDCLNMKEKEFFEKWLPMTGKVKVERMIRSICEKLGIYRPVKRLARKVLGKE